MASPMKCAVMDDFTRSINIKVPKTPAFLNGDTTARWTLKAREPLPKTEREEFLYFREPDIEEDGGLDGRVAELSPSRLDYTPEEAHLLYTPLSFDIPILRKDLLIQMAAYEGNADRYSRLMHPRSMGLTEFTCVLRGIYHSTMFARWWAERVETSAERVKTWWYSHAALLGSIKEAINARRVMINDISGFTNDTSHKPYHIWLPLKPLEAYLSILAQNCPSMTEQIAIACIRCDYEGTYTDLDIDLKSAYHIWLTAEQSPNPFYLENLKKKSAEKRITIHSYGDLSCAGDILEADLEPTMDIIITPMRACSMDDDGNGHGTYDLQMPDAGVVELYVWQSPDLLRKLENLHGGVCRGGLGWLEDEEIPGEDSV